MNKQALDALLGRVKAGDTVPVGAPMTVVGEPGEDADAAVSAVAALIESGFGEG